MGPDDLPDESGRFKRSQQVLDVLIHREEIVDTSRTHAFGAEGVVDRSTYCGNLHP